MPSLLVSVRIIQAAGECVRGFHRATSAFQRVYGPRKRARPIRIGRHALPNDISLERNDYICNDKGCAYAVALTRCQIRSAFA
jgi:hypothetical protein